MSSIPAICSPSMWICMCQPRSSTRFDSGSIMSAVVAPACDQVEADAAHAEVVQALELGVGHARVDDGDAARRRPDLAMRVQRGAFSVP